MPNRLAISLNGTWSRMCQRRIMPSSPTLITPIPHSLSCVGLCLIRGSVRFANYAVKWVRFSCKSTPDETDEQFTARLARKEAELKAEKNEKGSNSLESTIHIDSNNIVGKIFVFNRTWTYWFESEKRVDSTAASAHAYVRTPGASLNFTAKYGGSRVKELAQVITKIKPLKEGEISTEPGFCIGRAMLLDPLTASQNERVTMFLSLKDHPDFLIALDTEAGLKPNDPLLARDDRIKDEFASVAHALRRAERTISDIPGEELLERFRERDGIVSYSFTWESYSKQNDVFRPMLALEFSTDHSSRPGGKTI